jgi:hypothetical protein
MNDHINKPNNNIVYDTPNGKNRMNLGKEYRCPVCKRLLMKGKIIHIETRCPKCKKICTIKDQ